MMSKVSTVRYPLTARSIDEIAYAAEDFLASIRTERANILRIRLSLEEALLRWQERFGEEVEVSFTVGTRWRRPVVILELKGERHDPLTDHSDEFGVWSENLLTEVGMLPRYSYQKDTNILQIVLRRPQRNPSLNLLLAMAIGLGIGFMSSVVFPQSVQDRIIRTTLDPIQSLFARILNAASGPVIFLTVLVSVCGVGSIAVSGKAGRRILRRLISVTTILTTLSLILSINVFSLHFYNGPMSDTRFASVLDFFFQLIPNDLLSPFVSGDSPQIILMSIILANALLITGEQSEGIKTLIQQLNTVGLQIADWVGKVSPFFIVFLLILGAWNRSLRFVLGCWRPFLLFLLFTSFSILCWMLWICRTRGVRLSKLVRKLWPSFLVALRTSSVDAALGDSILCCEGKLGISPRVTSYGLPLGLVIYMPAGTIATMIFTIYAAKTYGIVISWIWCVTAVVLTVALLVATPPVVGIGLLTYTAIFSRLGIPSDGLILALLADVLFGFMTSAANQVMLQLELIIQADREGLLNLDILRK